MRESNNKQGKWVKYVLIITIVVIVSVFAWKCEKGDLEITENNSSIDTGIDEDATEGGHEEVDRGKIQSELNKSVEDGMINISMSTNPVFNDSDSLGNLHIVNEDINKYPQIVEIYRNDTNELIYKSGLIPVGSKIERAKLLTKLPKGVYKCTAYFSSIDVEASTEIGKAGAKIDITILK